MTPTAQRTRPGVDIAIAVALCVASTMLCLSAMRAYRAAGIQPVFYQGNFEPAVMMACGRGFHTTTPAAFPPSLQQFLGLKTNTFSCAELPPTIPLVKVTWNGTWYYLYGATALVWRFVGFSWTALDGLVAVLGGLTTVMLYALFRLVSRPRIAVAGAALLTLSHANLMSLLSLRDYSKAPFVLGAIFVLACLIGRSRTRRVTLALAVLFGAIVGIGYGFRGDLLVLAPFGVAMIALLLPGASLKSAGHSLVPAGIALVAFLIAAAPPLRGLGAGGCQFHYSLLGMTAPLVNEAAVEPALYSVGDHFTDTFVDLKVGDYAQRVFGQRAPQLCNADYDIVSGALFRRQAITFPADLAVHAYGTLLTITRSGFHIPDAPDPLPAALEGRATRAVYAAVSSVTHALSPIGPLVTMAAIGLAWAQSARLGIAATAFVLFLGGYPAIEFESRHWFHLRFIPWWSAAWVVTWLVRRRSAASMPGTSEVHPSMLRGLVGVAATLAALVVALTMLRAIQGRTVRSMLTTYGAAQTVPLPTTRSASSVAVDWRPQDYGSLPERRASDLLVVTLDPARCAPGGSIRVQYDADAPSHDLTTTIPLATPRSGSGPWRLFVPIFSNGLLEHSYLKFARLDTVGQPSECVADVATVADRSALPLWIQAQVPPDWTDRPWHQTLRVPRFLRTTTF